jgi:hypothetical protein
MAMAATTMVYAFLLPSTPMVFALLFQSLLSSSLSTKAFAIVLVLFTFQHLERCRHHNSPPRMLPSSLLLQSSLLSSLLSTIYVIIILLVAIVLVSLSTKDVAIILVVAIVPPPITAEATIPTSINNLLLHFMALSVAGCERRSRRRRLVWSSSAFSRFPSSW